MKCLSLTAPWSVLVVCGAKKIETRRWPGLPKYRGPLLIQTAKNFPSECRRICNAEPFRSALAKAGYASWDDLPLGKIVGRVELVDAYRFDADESRRQPEPERSFGDFSDGRVGLVLDKPVRLVSPVSFKGKLGLFEVPDELVSGFEWVTARKVA